MTDSENDNINEDYKPKALQRDHTIDTTELYIIPYNDDRYIVVAIDKEKHSYAYVIEKERIDIMIDRVSKGIEYELSIEAPLIHVYDMKRVMQTARLIIRVSNNTKIIGEAT
jgi:hypothetical protein